MSIEHKLQDQLMKQHPEDRPIILRLIADKADGTRTSRRDYKKMIKVRNRLRMERIKNGTS